MTHVRVKGVPAWVPHQRLLDSGEWVADGGDWVGERSPPQAADIAARLRNLGMGGHPFEVVTQPKLPRALVRSARTTEARRKRDTSAGFARKGVRLDEEGRRYLTPEALSLELGERAGAIHVIDACCGCGGNAIGFARAGARVTALELDADRLELARHNARIYGVLDRIRFEHADALQRLPSLDADLAFLDPPWGEPDRLKTTTVPLLEELIDAAAHLPAVWCKVPPSFVSLEGFLPEAWFGASGGDQQRVKFVLLTR